MRWLKIEAVAALAALAITATCLTMPVVRDADGLGGNCPRGDADLKELGEKLSSTGKIYFPGSAEFEQATARWSVLDVPKVNVVVVPGTENDVVETVGVLLSSLCFSIGNANKVVGEICQQEELALPGVQWRAWSHYHSRQNGSRHRDLHEPVEQRGNLQGRENSQDRRRHHLQNRHRPALGGGKADGDGYMRVC